jgi:hypothetical protein
LAISGILIANVCDEGYHEGRISSWDKKSILPGEVKHKNYYGQNIIITDYEHPIVKGKNIIVDKDKFEDIDNWYYSTHGYFINLPLKSSVIMGVDIISGEQVTSIQPTLIEYPYGRGKVIATMQTIEWQYGVAHYYHPGLYPYNHKLMENIIYYAYSQVIPEPTTIALMSTGLLCLIRLSRLGKDRRKNNMAKSH